jgi:hypothetical protein
VAALRCLLLWRAPECQREVRPCPHQIGWSSLYS